MIRLLLCAGVAMGCLATDAAMAQAPQPPQGAPAYAPPAGDHPLFLPTRDVAVTYQLSSGAGGESQMTHLYFDANQNKLRIDTPNGAGYTVLDKSAGQRMLVMNDRRAYATVPLDPGMADGFVLNSSMSYTRGGSDSVNGLACTDWSVNSPQTRGTACVTEDGVLLKGSGGPVNGQGQTSLVATDVSYGRQRPGIFAVPGGYQQMDPAQLQPSGPAGPR